MHRRIATLGLLGALLCAAPAAAAPLIGTELAPQRPLAAPAPGAQRATFRAEPPLTATPQGPCGPGSHPEPGMQGRVPRGAVSAKGFSCNMTEVGHEGRTGGLKVERYVDKAGHECAYYDTTLVFPSNILPAALDAHPTGTAVLDMSDPAKPVRTATLVTPAMQSPHESLLVNERRGLLAAVMGTLTTAPGFIDIYDLNPDCRHPVLLSSTPAGLLGHESGWSVDGRTFYATSLFTGNVTAVDVSNPKAPVTLWVGLYPSHGMTVSADGNRGYLASLGIGLQIIDTSEIQARKPNPQVHEITRLDWKSRSVPQIAIPVTIHGRPYLVENDEFSADDGQVVSANGQNVGAARLIDISDEHAPRVVSNLRLAVHQRENRAALAGDPGASFIGQGYAAHYCNVPRPVDPGVVACSMIASGLRLFDIRDPEHPREIAYYVAPPAPFWSQGPDSERSDYAMARPTFAPERGEVWYSDANSGFHAVRVTNGVWPFAPRPAAPPCTTRRVLTLVLRGPGGRPLRSARVTLGGRPLHVRRSGTRLTVRIDLRRVAGGRATLWIVGRTRGGTTVRKTRTYRLCA